MMLMRLFFYPWCLLGIYLEEASPLTNALDHFALISLRVAKGKAARLSRLYFHLKKTVENFQINGME